MSETGYFFSKEQAAMIAELIAQKVEEDHSKYHCLVEAYDKLTRGWTWKSHDHEARKLEDAK
jgi:transposase-like protein